MSAAATAERIALVPARGGSQRIPRKNIRSFCGIPAITRVVRSLHDSGVVDRVVVSTDDEEIAEVAREAGAETPFVRPAGLAGHQVGARPVIQHAMKALALPPRAVVGVVYATAVLTTTSDLQQSVRLLEDGNCEFVMSVAEFPAPIQRALVLDDNGRLSPREPKFVQERSQDLESAYYDIGQFYWGRASSWLTDRAVVQSQCKPFVVDAWRAVDIDTPEDWRRAEIAYRILHET